MKYPVKQVQSPFGGLTYEEMTPQEYEDELEYCRIRLAMCSCSELRRDQEYADYLRRWFGNEKCDGWDNFELRYQMHKLPMSYNVYFWG